MRKITLVIGTRPNFIKVTRFKELVESYDSLSLELVHTNQHFDDVMSSVFFRQFNIEVDHFLDRFEGSPNEHFGHIVQSLDRHFRASQPDLVIVVGDVNSTLAAALVANRLGIKTAHLESGLRSNDMEMPEEVNRILTDKITDYFFVTENSGLTNLKEEGVEDSRIFFVGNTMIDTLVHFQDSIEKSEILDQLAIRGEEYSLVTLHRPSNVDSRVDVEKMYDFLNKLSEEIKIVFPMHHRTLRKIKEFGLQEKFDELSNCVICGALDYFSFQKLIANSVIVITDSGGIQEETTFLQIPCITLRENTERPVTLTEGTNQLMDFDSERIIKIIKEKEFKSGSIPKFWDGNATARIVEVINEILD